MIERSNLELSPFGRDPTYFMHTTSSQLERIKKIKERSNQVRHTIMHWYGTRNIPLKIVVIELHMINHLSLLVASNTKQF
jgi:hypothetical protein